MTAIVIFALEGVLQSEGGRPVEAGCRLYRTVRNGLLYQPGVITSADSDTARRFFDNQHMSAPTFIHAGVPQTPPDWDNECRLLRRAYPYEIDWVIVPDPGIASILYYEGFRTLLLADPRYSRPEYRPDAKPAGASSWAALAEGLAADRKLIAADDRITPR